ncbi:MAG: Asp-tRNA(Asn)/Glu-tRNA(Gln) amidotransferase subunit GatB [Pyrodictiaceae archaeon]
MRTLTNGISNILIGLEVHVQITSLKTKLFCSCSADYRGAPPNTHVCPVCLGLPGALPVVNERAVEYAIKTCLALNGRVASILRFDRKHYFYPDLPKNYQITQYLEPICKGGWITIEHEGVEKRIRLKRINLEEDPGRIVYPTNNPLTSPYVLVDYNRSGIALMEIVTEPDMHSPSEALAFLTKLRSILEHLGVCDCSLEGAMRVDANISIEGGERVEVKNIGSLKDVERALTYEIIRQQSLISKGVKIPRETRHWDPVRRITVSARVKEAEEDYRYMPDPNLPPIPIPKELIEKIESELPELPDARIERLIRAYKIPRSIAKILVYTSKTLADFFEEAVKAYPQGSRDIANYIANDLLGWIKEEELKRITSIVKPEYVAKAIRMVREGRITIRQAKQLTELLVKTGKDPEKLAEELGFTRISDRALLERIVEEVFNENPKAVKDAMRKPKAVNYLIGMVMRKTKGKADPEITREIVLAKLSKLHKASH